MKCDLCNKPICLKCLTSNYNSHAVEEIIEMWENKLAAIQKNADKLRSEVIPKFEKLLIDEDEKMKKMIQAYK